MMNRWYNEILTKIERGTTTPWLFISRPKEELLKIKDEFDISRVNELAREKFGIDLNIKLIKPSIIINDNGRGYTLVFEMESENLIDEVSIKDIEKLTDLYISNKFEHNGEYHIQTNVKLTRSLKDFNHQTFLLLKSQIGMNLTNDNFYYEMMWYMKIKPSSKLGETNTVLVDIHESNRS